MTTNATEENKGPMGPKSDCPTQWAGLRSGPRGPATTVRSRLVLELEGSIASGKSTLSRQLKTAYSGTVLEESVNIDFLGAFYKETKKYAFAFQMAMLARRLGQVENAEQHEKGNVFLDRGLIGDTIFADLHHASGNISDDEIRIYSSVCRDVAGGLRSGPVDAVLYLDASPETCETRIKKRARSSEEYVSLDYLNGLDARYFEHMMLWMGGRPDPRFNWPTPAPPVVVFVWDEFGKTEDVWTKVQQVLEANGKDEKDAKQGGASVSFWVGSDFPADAGFLAVDWAKRSDSATRRLVWSTLAKDKPVVFFGGHCVGLPTA